MAQTHRKYRDRPQTQRWRAFVTSFLSMAQNGQPNRGSGPKRPEPAQQPGFGTCSRGSHIIIFQVKPAKSRMAAGFRSSSKSKNTKSKKAHDRETSSGAASGTATGTKPLYIGQCADPGLSGPGCRSSAGRDHRPRLQHQPAHGGC